MKLLHRYGGGSVDDPSDLASPVRQEDEDDSDGEEPLLSGEWNKKKNQNGLAHGDVLKILVMLENYRQRIKRSALFSERPKM